MVLLLVVVLYVIHAHIHVLVQIYTYLCMWVMMAGWLVGFDVVVMAINNLCRPEIAKVGDLCGMTELTAMYKIGHLRS